MEYYFHPPTDQNKVSKLLQADTAIPEECHFKALASSNRALSRHNPTNTLSMQLPVLGD
jgi:hypothetical protein